MGRGGVEGGQAGRLAGDGLGLGSVGDCRANE